MQNVVNKNKMLMLCLIACLVLLMAVAILITSATGAVASAASENQASYKVLVNSKILEHTPANSSSNTSFSSSFFSDLNDYYNSLPSGEEQFFSASYVLEFASDSSSDEDVTLRFGNERSGFEFGIRFDPNLRYGAECFIGFGSTDSMDLNPVWHTYSFSEDDIGSSINPGDRLYFTCEHPSIYDRVFIFSYLSWYTDYDNEQEAYEKSLDNVLLKITYSESPELVDHLVYLFAPQYQTNGICERKVIERTYFYKETTLSIPEKEGYKFTGWFYDEACTRPYKGEPITSDVNLYAGFEKLKYNVFFESCYVDPTDPNTAGLYDYSAVVEYGDVAVYPLELPDDATLAGWYFADGSKYENTPVTSDMHLYGRYYCTLTFELTGVDEKIDSIQVEYGSYIKLPIPTTAPDRYAFSGWECPDIPSWTEEQPIISDMHFVSYWYRNIFTVTFYVDSEIYKQIDVAYGAVLAEVSSSVGIDTNAVVGYENCSILTSAVAFNDFAIVDDVNVYLSYVDEGNLSDDGSSGSFKNQVNTFFNNVGQFFGKIGNFFTTQWKIIVACLGGVVGIAVAIAVLVKIKR